MSLHGRSTAADRRVSNNALYMDFVPENMSEEQQLAAALSNSADDGDVDGSASNLKRAPPDASKMSHSAALMAGS